MKDYKVFHVKGDSQLIECMKNETVDGFEIEHVVWTGNIEAKVPQLVTPSGQDTKTGFIHLYLIILSRPHVELKDFKGPRKLQ